MTTKEELNQQKEHDKEYFELFEERDKLRKNRDCIFRTSGVIVYKLQLVEAKISEAKRQKKRQIEFLERLLHNLNVAECDRDSQQKGDSAKWKSEADKVKFETSALHSESTTDALSSISAIIEEIKILKMEVERE